MWVAQQPCDKGNGAQAWKLTSRGGAVTVTDPSGGFALTVSNRPYYGNWLLDLQRADGRAAQAWTVQKAGFEHCRDSMPRRPGPPRPRRRDVVNPPRRTAAPRGRPPVPLISTGAPRRCAYESLSRPS